MRTAAVIYLYMKMLSKILLLITTAVITYVPLSAQTILSTTSGQRVDLDDHKGKVVVIAVGAAWLPLSDKQADFTKALVKKYAGRDVVFYFVVTDSTNPRSKNFADDQTIDRFANARGLSIPVLRDSDGAITMKRYKVEQIPSFVILDKEGRPAVEPFGGLDPKFDLTGPISRTIDRLL